MSLSVMIRTWTGPSTERLEAAYTRFGGDADFISQLIGCMDDPSMERAATWLLKHHLEQVGSSCSVQESAGLYRRAPKLAHWESRLHVLQSMRFVPVPARQARAAERFLDACLAEDNKFVRAWAYSGYYELAAVHDRYREETLAMLEDAIAHEEAASVRARVRKLLRVGFPAG